ncbi:hypothetical protein FIV42_00765 [Persicimonas caeni]|uniref:Uncharacterized protein n=1 Tax=Persicimonas caeni TaxID=2292766 RepID=A0A4Y6PLX7_PERCE|nr:hypothetical protein [Persicimonas caeni]QDG49316.1 hypothetical protein FIV42_00765 [Persicimonas caeni]QED30537.1 hypothetical protein FRD00_00760 [Persicimonas caeni]
MAEHFDELPAADYATVDGYDGDYVISRDGEVWSLKGPSPNRLSTFAGALGPRVTLWRHGKRTQRYVHVLIKEAFGDDDVKPDDSLALYIREQYGDDPDVTAWADQTFGRPDADRRTKNSLCVNGRAN